MRPGINCLFRLCLLFLVALPGSAHAFYEQDSENGSIEMRGLLRGAGLISNNPDAPLLYSKRNVSGIAGSARLMVQATHRDGFSFEMHAVQNYVPTLLQTGGSRFAQTQGVERSDVLDWSFDQRRAHLFLDRLNLQYASDRFVLKAGRQPVNLAATFYFTPNDFFAPFAAQTFFRSYKPGVDAVRADVQFGELSQLSLISVLGYSAQATGDNGWSNRPDSSRNSYLARASTVAGDFELALLAGSIRKDRVIGGDFQGEFFEWLGVRGEGHINFPDAPLAKRTVEFALGLEHRWENTFTARVEQFYHGGGVSSKGGYSLQALSTNSSSPYLARNYTAAGASYEFTPLLTGDVLALHNWVDGSSLIALYALYSLSDESEMAVSANLPVGKAPAGLTLQSEFGTYPASLNIEFRSYF